MFTALSEELLAIAKAAETPQQFEEAMTMIVLLVWEHLPNVMSTARAMAAFIRGLLEGAGQKFPWNLETPHPAWDAPTSHGP